MKQTGDIFLFYRDTSNCPRGTNDIYVAFVRSGISSTTELLDELFQQLRLPSYFGFNWNALSDCIRDFSWLQQSQIVLIHQDLPLLGRFDLKVYLDVLTEGVQSWRAGENHSFLVWFHEDSKGQLIDLLS